MIAYMVSHHGIHFGTEGFGGIVRMFITIRERQFDFQGGGGGVFKKKKFWPWYLSKKIFQPPPKQKKIVWL